jgi:hypothetical protein
LMRHPSLKTTSKYTRTVMERMKEAVQNMGKPLEAKFWGQIHTQNNSKRQNA